MIISVFIRNYWYITYFGLAYKRIAVIFFLILTLIGLISIIIKILNKKTIYYLLKINSFSLVLTLLITSCFQWSSIIAKHNFKNSHKSFIEYSFLSKLNNASLPFTVKTIDELKTIDENQEKAMPFDIKSFEYINSEKYFEIMKTRKDFFLNNYKSKSILEWNFSDYITYKRLK